MEPVIIFTLVILSTLLSQFFGRFERVENRKTFTKNESVSSPVRSVNRRFRAKIHQQKGLSANSVTNLFCK